MPRHPLFPPPKDPATDKPVRHKGSQPRSWLTINGRIRVWRVRYHGSGGSDAPLDDLIDALQSSSSIGTSEIACRLNGDSTSFAKTAANLERTAQIVMGKDSVRVLVENEGRRVQAAKRAGELPAGWTAADCRVPVAAPPVEPPTPPMTKTIVVGGPAAVVSLGWTADEIRRPAGEPHPDPLRTRKPAPACVEPAAAPPPLTRVYMGADGVMVGIITQIEKDKRREGIKARRRRAAADGKPLRPLPAAKPGADNGYKEFKIVEYYDEEIRHRHISCTAGDCHVAGRIMRRDAKLIGLSAAHDTAGIFDGAEWIRNQVKGQSLHLNDNELDFYHFSEHVHEARRAVFGHESADGEDRAARMLHSAKHEGYEPLWQALVEWRAKLRSPTKRKAADALMNYVSERRDMLDYPTYLAKGRRIGSGSTESMSKTTTARLRNGRKWDSDNAESVMAMSCLEESSQWQAWWASRLLKAAG